MENAVDGQNVAPAFPLGTMKHCNNGKFMRYSSTKWCGISQPQLLGLPVHWGIAHPNRGRPSPIFFLNCQVRGSRFYRYYLLLLPIFLLIFLLLLLLVLPKSLDNEILLPWVGIFDCFTPPALGSQVISAVLPSYCSS